MLLRLVLVCALLQPGFVGSFANQAAAQTSSSGGYGRPSGGGYAPSASSSGRRPAISGGSGYSRPSFAAPSIGYAAPSSSDRAISRRSSSQSLDSYNARRAAPPPSSPAPPSVWDQARRPSALPSYGYNGATPFGTPYAAPYAAQGQRFGGFEAAFLFSMLNAALRPGPNADASARFFRDNQNDPGYQQWRQSLNNAARTDPALAAKIAQLDTQIGQQQSGFGKPLPLDNAARMPTQMTSSPGGPGGLVWLILLLGGGTLALLWLARRRATRTAQATAPPGITGSEAHRLRVGMIFPMDPTPFILADGVTKVTAPPADGMINVEALGLVQDGAVSLHRLYLPGRQGFFQLHMGADGAPDECRYFSVLDEINPATPDEWGFWLDQAQGMIGWPQFQTKDNLVYARAWSPGPSRIAPRAQTETIQDLKGTASRAHQSMLYSRNTAAAAPAPSTEYLLVSAIKADGQAWIELLAGIDINPAALNLPAVKLDS